MLKEFIGCMRDQKFNLKDMYDHMHIMKMEITRCQVCGKYTFDDYFPCHVCGWEYDSFIEDGYSELNNSYIDSYRDRFLKDMKVK